jgi:hypothetical protein
MRLLAAASGMRALTFVSISSPEKPVEGLCPRDV